ncbi:MAG: CRISPR system precrRNA processing endoribonuclease RAMP protein Cas6 [Candidatus Aenigmatarchaeota archaeon]
MSSFVRITLCFCLNEPIKFQSFSGYSVRGLFYNIIKNIDEEYAINLHNSKTLAPFSTSPILIEKNNEVYPCFNKVERGLAKINFVLLEDKLINLIIKFIQEKIGTIEIKLGENKLFLNSISLENISFEKIYEQSNEIKSFKINFLTPTYFRLTPKDIEEKYKKKINIKVSPYRFLPLPDPILFFRSIARLWRKFSKYDLNLESFLEWINLGGIALSGYPDGIKTHIVYEHPTTKKWSVGFTGKVHFSLVKDLFDSKKAKIADTLLKFAEYTNVGGGRTAGLGMIKYEIEK